MELTKSKMEQGVAFESLNASDKQILIKSYFEEPIKFFDEKNKAKIKRNCIHWTKDKVGDSEFHGNFLTHIRSIDGWKERLAHEKSSIGGPLDKVFHRVSTKAQTYHNWIEWVN